MISIRCSVCRKITGFRLAVTPKGVLRSHRLFCGKCGEIDTSPELENLLRVAFDCGSNLRARNIVKVLGIEE